MANPCLRPYMTFYPEERGEVLETWHGSKWVNDLPDHLLTPMAIHPVSFKHFFIDELCRSRSGEWFIPKRWVKISDELHAYGFEVQYNREVMIYPFDNLI